MIESESGRHGCVACLSSGLWPMSFDVGFVRPFDGFDVKDTTRTVWALRFANNLTEPDLAFVLWRGTLLGIPEILSDQKSVATLFGVEPRILGAPFEFQIQPLTNSELLSVGR